MVEFCFGTVETLEDISDIISSDGCDCADKETGAHVLSTVFISDQNIDRRIDTLQVGDTIEFTVIPTANDNYTTQIILVEIIP